jgi:inositol transport system substrate-binding protein
MKQGIKLVGLLAAGALALSACGTTASTPTSSAPTDGSEAPSSQAIETVNFEPGEVVKPADGEVIKIGVTFPILDQFLQTVADGIEARAAEAGVEVTIVAAQEKADVQLGQVENFISQGLDGIIIIPVDTDAAGPMTEKAMDAEIPLVYVNRRPSDLPVGVPYVGSNSLVAGQLQMEALAELADGKGKVGILIGDPANEAARDRTEGCKQILEEYPEMELLREQAGNWYREEGLAITENWIQSGDEIDIICANNDEMALGAIQALKNADKLDDVLVGGVDATADALAAMAAGELEVTVFQDAAGQGAGGVDSIINLYNGEEVAGVIDVPYQLVTPDNMADFEK